jgi:hypothetical protein
MIDDNIKYYPSKIIKISDGGIDETCDIEVENIKQFTANGIIVHNSAGISFSNLSDDRMRRAKTGQWWLTDGQRALTNNSVMYTEKPDLDSFSKE